MNRLTLIIINNINLPLATFSHFIIYKWQSCKFLLYNYLSSYSSTCHFFCVYKNKNKMYNDKKVCIKLKHYGSKWGNKMLLKKKNKKNSGKWQNGHLNHLIIITYSSATSFYTSGLKWQLAKEV